jgi:2-methylcitrate dehydratase PrpD
MDHSTQTIVEYADALTYEDLSSACVEAAKVRLADSIGCLLGGIDSPPSRIARELAKTIVGNPGARVIGDGTLTAPDVAAFTNGVMLRYLDYNDTWVSKGSLHPSDLIPAVLAVAEVTHASGKNLLLGVVLGYEVAGALSHAISTRERGFDEGIFTGGKDGLFERVAGEFDFQLPNRGGAFVVQETNIKLHPTEYHSQAFLDLVPFILERTNVDQIEALDIETYWVCCSEIGAEPAKWEPDTRETADHSLPFILACGLRDGSVTLGSFSDANIHGEAEDGLQAIDLARALRPDVVLLDVVMPGQDGITTADQMRTLVPDSAVIMLSLHDDAETRVRATAAGAAKLVGKHEPISSLLAAIRQTVRTENTD